MILALLIANNPDESAYLATGEGGAVIETVAATALRGPFGAVMFAARADYADRLDVALEGFALQHVDASTAKPGAHGVLIAAIKAAEAFRLRWEKVRAAAAGRFENKDAGAGKKSDWGKHKQSADVKIRGLARSFDRDGILVIPADAHELKAEHLARVVEAFARDGQDATPHSFAQAVSNGERGWPVGMTLDAAKEVSALPPETDFAAWLLKNVQRVKDVNL